MSHKNSAKSEESNERLKVHCKDLLPETLNAYKLPWDWDEYDANYIVIKKWIDEDLQEDLFADTRRIREGKVLRRIEIKDDRSITQYLSSGNSYYQPPECVESQRPLSFDVNLKGSAIKRSVDEFRADPSHRENLSQKIDIVSSRMPGYGKVILYRADATVQNQEPQFSWIHMQTETRSFDDFLRFATNVPNLANEDRALVLSLLKKTGSQMDGGSLPTDVMRCVGLSSTVLDEMTSERSAIFLRFPYYSIQSMKDAVQRPHGGHHTRSLLQYFYNLESTRKRDLEQVVRKVGLFQKDKIVHVSQLWAVIVNFEVLITSAPMSLVDRTSSSLEIMDPPASKSLSPSIICVVDPIQRQFFFPMENCKTFFAMRHSIIEHCLPPKYNSRGYDFELRTSDKMVIKAEDWAKVTTSHGSTVFRVHVQVLSPESSKERSEKGHSKTSLSPMREAKLLTDKASANSDYQDRGKIRDEAKFEEQEPLEEKPLGHKSLAHDQSDEEEQESSEQEKSDEDEKKGGTLFKYAQSVLSSGAEGIVRRSQLQMRPIPPSSGLVVNQSPNGNPNGNLPSASNIYFEPAIPSLPPGKGSATHEKPVPNDPKDDNYENQNSEGSQNFRRSATLDSVFGESSITQPSSHNMKQRISLEFPPVFTWPVGNKSVNRESSRSGEGIKGHSRDNPGDESSPKSKAQFSNEISETSSPQEETIEHVSSHINRQLLGDGSKAREIYERGTTKTYFDADKAIRQQWAVSLPSLIGTVGQSEDPGLPHWETALREIVISLCRLFNFFVPLAHPCTVGSKFWGAIHDLITIIPQMCDRSRMLELTNRTRHRMTESFFIADIGRPEYADLRGKTDLDIPFADITDCRKCNRSREYSTQSGALDHLFKHHFFQTSPEQRSIITSQSQWVMDFGCYLTFICRKDGQQILRELEDFVTSLEKMAFQIQHGVSENGKFDEETYRIPSSLVNAFQHLLMMTVAGAYMAKTSYEIREAYTDPGPLPSFLTPSVSGKVTLFGMDAEISMENAIKDIVLMTYTDQLSDVVTYEAASPSLVIALIFGDSYCCRGSENEPLSLVEIYRGYVLGLQFKAGQHPNRRLLQDIYLVREELAIIERISQEQRNALVNYRSVLDPSSFRITTESRVSAFELEKEQLNQHISQIDADITVIGFLVEKLDSLATQTSKGVDVRQEDQAKAILVFTIVTVVFMPLSFFTSYLGMNTSDIRDMESSQSLFWTISIPLTVVIIAVILSVAFQAERIRELFDTLLGNDRASPMANPVPIVSRERGVAKDGGIRPESSAVTGWRVKKWLARRRAGWKSRSDHTFDV
ncbi:hypothetical protein N7530_005570 [Penicillium desertorum]|uniref:Uncharacterized protein n=1 Tax=Penicillium desertorum TaxID=1303715 RepID=A0A9W9X1H8_9EURO|nr:hypothetical protein N7530_005570 [Penicillium desertorum]